MLDFLRAVDFQGHADTRVDFDSCVTTIVGPNDVGKSALIRALRWAVLNQPVSSMIRDGCKTAVAEVRVDGKLIRREKGSDNLYALDGREFRAFRTEVPRPVAELLNVDELSFQGQHDPSFWFCCSAGDVARQLNEVVDLGIIDATLSEVTSVVYQSRASVKVAEDRLTESVTARDGLRWVEEANVDLIKVEEMDVVCFTMRNQVGVLFTVLKDVEDKAAVADSSAAVARDADRVVARAKDFGALVVDVSALDAAVQDGTERSNVRDRLSSIYDHANQVLTAARSVGALGSDVSKLESCIASVVRLEEERGAEVPSLDGIGVIMDDVIRLRDEVEKLDDLRIDVCRFVSDVKHKRSLLKMAEDDFAAVTGGRCPLCGGEMK